MSEPPLGMHRQAVCKRLVVLCFLLAGCGDTFSDDTPVTGPISGNNDVNGSLDGGYDGVLTDTAVAIDVPVDVTVDIAVDVTVDVAVAPDAGIVDVSGCGAGCPAGFVCFVADDGQASCLPGPAFACTPCTTDATCLGGVCKDFGDGTFCEIPCLQGSSGSSCPQGFACAKGVCEPSTGSCTCLATTLGKQQGCASGGAGQGVCGGVQICAALGWSNCNAAQMTTESCNGLDDDCDGQTDEGLGGAACGQGICVGKTVCGAGTESCGAPAAITETCNQLDDDCDGETDEGFIGLPEHCGSCGASCLVANAPGKCAYDAPDKTWHCECNPGYYWTTDGCAALTTYACLPCKSDADCGGDANTGGCTGTGTCQVPCGVDLPGCPTGYACDQGHCLAPGGDCSCTAAQAGLQKPCFDGTCAGTQTCNPTKGWSTCTAAAPGAEICNNLDDDCNGATDDVAGLGTACVNSTAIGTCSGKNVCTANGLQCDAAEPGVEICNGQDDDCDGLTDNDVGADGPCNHTNGFGTCAGLMVCNPAKGLFCDGKIPSAEACNSTDDDCNGAIDDGWLDPDTGLYSTTKACGKCGNVCPLPTGAHATPLCDGKAGVCAMGCEPGWADMNDNASDGCECLFISDLDEPDGVDQNCDGIDGEVDKGVFVAKTGADGNPGTLQLPVASVQKAISIAEFQGKRDVYVAGGVFAGSLDLAAGVSLYGGYGPGFAARDTVTYQTAIVGVATALGPSVAVRCTNILGGDQLPKTRVDGFTVLAATAKATGESSYAVLSNGCDARVQFAYNHLAAGDGAAGLSGTPGQNGGKGLNGGAGIKAKDIGHGACVAADLNPGGTGGGTICADADAAGGQGGTTVCPAFDEDAPSPACPAFPYTQSVEALATGQSGAGIGAGKGGLPGADSYIDSFKGKVTKCLSDTGGCNLCRVPVKQRYGDDGVTGGQGAMGGPGAGSNVLQGKVIGGTWSSVPGTGGDPGSTGGGGGGGGAAGGVEVHDCTATSAAYTDLGGSGGGGGSGGCGGTGGSGGASGGGSFAVFLIAAADGTTPILVGNTLSSGTGGQGGTGGPSGSGGSGGVGGKGGASGEDQTVTFCTSKGGTGGDGGHGGHGGGGGGGCGGPSVLLAVAGAPSGTGVLLKQQNQMKVQGSAGKGGNGGPSIGNPGLAGSVGLATGLLEL